MDVRVGLWRKRSAEKLMLFNVVLEKTLESPLDCKEIQLVHPKGDQSWVSTGRTDAKVETPVLWPPHEKSWLIGKDPHARRQEEIGGRRRRGRQRMRWLDGITNSMGIWVWVNSRSWLWTGRPGVLQFMGSQRVGHDWATELNWSTQVADQKYVWGEKNPHVTLKSLRSERKREKLLTYLLLQRSTWQNSREEKTGDTML